MFEDDVKIVILYLGLISFGDPQQNIEIFNKILVKDRKYLT